MTTIINNPSQGDNSSGLIVGVTLFVILGILFFMYALPAIRNNDATPKQDSLDINIKLPPKASEDTTALAPEGY